LGYDDVSYYNEIAKQLGKQVNVKAVETIREYINKSGCTHVINAIDEVEETIRNGDLERGKAEKYVLGIIDEDARRYRNADIPSSNLFLILQVYAVESHFDIDELLIQFIQEHTYIDNKLLEGNNILSYVKSSLNKNYQTLWYISLEALKSTCDELYGQSRKLVRYNKDSIIKFYKDSKIKKRLFEEKNGLDDFSDEKGLVIDDIKKIAKGKWFLEVYIYSIIDKIKELSSACHNGVVRKCPYCLTTMPEPSAHCQYKPRINFMENNLKAFFFQNVYRCQEIEYIYQRINQLG